MSDNKRIAKNTLFMYLRMFFTMCVSLYTSRVILSALGFTDYGLYNVIGGVVAMFGFLNGAMTNAISRYLTYELGGKDIIRLKEVFSTSIIIQILLGLLIILLGETIGLWFLQNKMTIPENRLFAAEWVYQLSLLSMFLLIINVPYSAAVIAHEKMSAFAYISVLDAILKLLIVYLLVLTPFDKLIFYSTLFFLIQLIDFLIYRWYSRKHFEETTAKIAWNKELFYRIFNFAGWSTIGNLFYLFYTQGLNIILNMLCGPVVNAARGIAVQVEGVIKQFASNVQTAINPQIIKSYAINDLPRMYSLIFASSRYCFFLLFIIELPLILQIPCILKLWLGDYPVHAEIFVILTLVNSLIESLTNPLFTANLATGKIKFYNLCNSINSTIFIPITYLSLKYTLLPEIVFYCLITTNLVGAIVKVFIVKWQIGLGIYNYFSSVICHIIPVILLTLPVMLFIKPFLHQGFIGLIETILLSSIIISLAVFFFGTTVNERIYIVKKSNEIRSIILNKHNRLE